MLDNDDDDDISASVGSEFNLRVVIYPRQANFLAFLLVVWRLGGGVPFMFYDGLTIASCIVTFFVVVLLPLLFNAFASLVIN